MKKATKVAYLRNFVFGVEDSIVSTVGLLSGIAIAGLEGPAIFATGVVLIFVEAISMSAGSFLSESSAEEYESHTKTAGNRSGVSALVMFISYFISGFVPLVPYLLVPVASALPLSIGFSIVALFLLGFASARVTKTAVMKSVLRMVLIGGLAIAVGATVGSLVTL